MFIAPLAGALSDKIPAKNLIGVGLAMQAAALAWMASVSTPTTPYSQLIGPFIVAGVGMALFFAPVANVVLSAVRPEEAKRPGRTTRSAAGRVFGVAVLASIFAHVGGYGTGRASDGMNPPSWSCQGRRAQALAVHDPPASRSRGSSPSRSRGRPIRLRSRPDPGLRGT
jgi:MFS family permease